MVWALGLVAGFLASKVTFTKGNPSPERFPSSSQSKPTRPVYETL